MTEHSPGRLEEWLETADDRALLIHLVKKTHRMESIMTDLTTAVSDLTGAVQAIGQRLNVQVPALQQALSDAQAADVTDKAALADALGKANDAAAQIESEVSTLNGLAVQAPAGGTTPAPAPAPAPAPTTDPTAPAPTTSGTTDTTGTGTTAPAGGTTDTTGTGTTDTTGTATGTTDPGVTDPNPANPTDPNAPAAPATGTTDTSGTGGTSGSTTGTTAPANENPAGASAV